VIEGVDVRDARYELDDSRPRFDFGQVHGWLSGAYWSPGITRAEVEHGFDNSTLVVGAYRESQQAGCLRVVSDRTRFAYLMDVFVAPEARGGGLGRALVRFALVHPALRLVYQWTLATADAHEVYAPLGFAAPANPERYMVLSRPRDWIDG
jgi:GNAT superfamily N-acetyltransferase